MAAPITSPDWAQSLIMEIRALSQLTHTMANRNNIIESRLATIDQRTEKIGKIDDSMKNLEVTITAIHQTLQSTVGRVLKVEQDVRSIENELSTHKTVRDDLKYQVNIMAGKLDDCY